MSLPIQLNSTETHFAFPLCFGAFFAFRFTDAWDLSILRHFYKFG